MLLAGNVTLPQQVGLRIGSNTYAALKKYLYAMKRNKSDLTRRQETGDRRQKTGGEASDSHRVLRGREDPPRKPPPP